MIYFLAKQRFLSNIITFRFAVSFILCVVLFAASTVILLQDFSERLADYGDTVVQTEKDLQNILVFSDLHVNIARPPTPLSTVCEGLEKHAGSAFNVAFDHAPRIAEESGMKNPLLAVFTVFDLATVVELILSLLVVFVAYNSISGERESGTLKLILTNTVPRYAVLLGSYLGGMATVVLPLAVGTLMSLLIMEFNPAVSLTIADYLGLGMIFVLAVLMLGVFYLAGMFLSARLARSSTVLIILLVSWVVTVLILPNGAIYLAKELKPVPDKATVDSQAQALENQWKVDMNNYAQVHPRPWQQIASNLGPGFSVQDAWNIIKKVERDRYVYTGDWPYAKRVLYAVRELMEWYESGSIYGHQRSMYYEDQTWNLYVNYRQQLENQARLARFMSLFSPSWAFYHASTYVTDTGEDGYLSFVDQASRYRNEIIAYMKNNGGLDSYLLFTRKPVSEFLSAREVADIIDAGGENTFKDIVNYQVDPLDLSDLPRFRFSRPGPLMTVIGAWPEITVLILFNLLFFSLAWAAFLRADVR